MTAYLLNPEAMKRCITARVLSTLRDLVLHPKDITAQNCKCCNCDFVGLFWLFKATIGILKTSTSEAFSIAPGSLLQFCREVISYSNWKGHGDLFRHRVKKCKCQKKKLKKVNVRTVQNRAAMVTSLQHDVFCKHHPGW